MMAINIWRGVCAGLVLLLLLQFYILLPLRPEHVFSAQSKAGRFFGTSWSYEPRRDSANTALTSAQCDKAFPNLYYELDRSVKYWKTKDQTITAENIDITGHPGPAFKVLIHNNQLSITGHSHIWLWPVWRERSIFLLSQLHRALLGATAAGETLPTVEFSVVVGDRAALPEEGNIRSFFSLTRAINDAAKEALWLVPDFNFFAGPPNATSWQRMQNKARLYDTSITNKIPKLAWRGVVGTNAELRGALLQVTGGKEWADVGVMDWDDRANFMDMDDFCRYQFLVHTEGISYSSRLKHLLNCNSVPIIHDLAFTEFFYHLLIPSGEHQNFVAVRRDFYDLEWHINQLLNDPSKAQRIADNAVATFRDRYTSPAAEACYWRRLVQRYAEVSFKPDPVQRVSLRIDGKWETKDVLRGDTFENILLHLKDDD